MQQPEIRIYRLTLKSLGKDGKPRTVTIGDDWIDDSTGERAVYEIPDDLDPKQLKKAPLPAKVGAIFLKAESRENSSWVEKEKDEENKDRNVTVTESSAIPAHYEVWGWPDEDTLLDRAGFAWRKRYDLTEVLSADEVWPQKLARLNVTAGFAAMSEASDTADEPDNGAAKAQASA